MLLRFLIVCCLLAAHLVHASQEPWQAAYKGKDAEGDDVLGHWSFESEQGLKLAGARLNSQGRFGAALESFPGHPIEDKRHAGLVKVGAVPASFSLEMWISPKESLKPQLRCYLLDKKYVDHQDYQWLLGEADHTGARRMTVNLGFGSESRSFTSELIKLAPGQWVHVAFTYDGAGTGRFYANGSTLGGATLAGLGAVVTGGKELSLGDRLGSNYGGFPGYIDEVRVCAGSRRFEAVDLQILSDRRVWRRMERAKPMEVVVTNLAASTLKAARLKLSLDTQSADYLLPDLAPAKSHTLRYEVNTALRPGDYLLRARLEHGSAVTEQTLALTLAARPTPRMPVVMWGAGGEEILRLKDLGFTHFVGFSAQNAAEIWQEKKALPAGPPAYVARNRRFLDEALAHGLEVVASLSPLGALESNPAHLRVDRKGVPYARRDIVASNPEFAPFFQSVGSSTAKAYADHPAFAAALINSEVRDSSQPSFSALELEAYRKATGSEIPPEVQSRWGVDWTKLKDFPFNRVVAADHPILNYYRWFWTVGDGWNGLHTALHKGVKSASSRLWTFFDPAVRQPSISGAGGSVDVLSHWTYTYPDPLKIGLCTDQLFAMSAASARAQKVMKMTQLIWYRSQTAPIGAKPVGDPVPWEDHDPEAAYITIAPMHLREAFWAKIARPISGIMYHGWQSLVETGSPSAYRFTNPHTAPLLRELVKTVIEPLGPSLLEIPDERSEVAFLESFTSQMFARRGSYGSNLDWAADVWLALQHAHVQCDVIFEETLLKGGLSGRRYLVMPHCDVLTAPLVERIASWQKQGGKIIADEFLCPALKADFVLQSFRRVKQAAQDKASVLELARLIQGMSLSQKVTCDNPEVIVRTRRYGDANYLFVVNDRREYGRYVGQHQLVMENGLAATARLGVKTEAVALYDLLDHRILIPQRSDDGVLSWPVELGPAEGRIFMLLPKPLLSLQLQVAPEVKLGAVMELRLEVQTTGRAVANAVLPVEVIIRDANGNAVEGSGHYAAKGGQLLLRLDVATNDEPGTWEIGCRELASGMQSRVWTRVLP